MLVISDNDEHLISLPDPMLRAPRIIAAHKIPSTTLYSGKNIGCEAIVAIVSRDTSGTILNEIQRLSHFPASSLICLSWYNNLDIGIIKRQDEKVSWQRFHEKVLISGSQSKPTVYWSRHNGRGGMIYLRSVQLRHYSILMLQKFKIELSVHDNNLDQHGLLCLMNYKSLKMMRPC